MTEQQDPRNSTTDESTRNTGKGMIWAAWILGLIMLTWFFQGALDKQWNPNQDPSTTRDNLGRNVVVLEQNRYGHYVTEGKINGEQVTFLLDTGATQVSVPEVVANRLNLTASGQRRVGTANGTVTVFNTRLDSLSIGNITLYDVAAHINPHMQSDEILLGMSALKRVEFTQSGKRLTIRD